MSGLTLQFPIVPFDCFQPSPAKRFLSLTKSPGALSPTYIDNIFRELKSLPPDQILGDWDGFILPTGHSFESDLEELNWFGSTFNSTEDVAPLTVAKNGERVEFEDWGRASVSINQVGRVVILTCLRFSCVRSNTKGSFPRRSSMMSVR